MTGQIDYSERHLHYAYIWVSEPYGDAEEGTVWVVPIETIDDALSRAHELYDGPGVEVRRVSRSVAVMRARGSRRARFGHTDSYRPMPGTDPTPDGVEASSHLWR